MMSLQEFMSVSGLDEVTARALARFGRLPPLFALPLAAEICRRPGGAAALRELVRGDHRGAAGDRTLLGGDAAARADIAAAP